VPLDRIAEAITAVRPALVATVQGDTSTTMCQPLTGLGELCHEHGALLYADVTASLGGNRFEMDAMLEHVEEILQGGAAAGYPLTRIVAHMEWALLDVAGVDDLLEYEARANYVLPKYDDPAICVYDLSRFNAGVAIDVMRAHPMVIVGGVLQENPFYVPPEQLLLEIRERRSARNGPHSAN